MSRTDAHRPWRVQQTDPAVPRIQWHHHWTRDGRSLTCDLWSAGGLGVCSWWPLRNICGCRPCSGHDERRAERRRDRHQSRRQVREAVKDYAQPRVR